MKNSDLDIGLPDQNLLQRQYFFFALADEQYFCRIQLLQGSYEPAHTGILYQPVFGIFCRAHQSHIMEKFLAMSLVPNVAGIGRLNGN